MSSGIFAEIGKAERSPELDKFVEEKFEDKEAYE